MIDPAYVAPSSTAQQPNFSASNVVNPGALVATAPASERVYWAPVAGKHELVVTDGAGRKARRILDVKSGLSSN